MSAEILAFLSTKGVDSILSTHPNRLFSSKGCTIPSEWAPWWAWAGNEDLQKIGDSHVGTTDAPPSKWLLVLRYYSRMEEEETDPACLSIPEEVKSLVDAARRMQVSREMGGLALSVCLSISLLRIYTEYMRAISTDILHLILQLVLGNRGLLRRPKSGYLVCHRRKRMRLFACRHTFRRSCLRRRS